LSKPSLEDFSGQLIYRLGMYEHLLMTQDVIANNFVEHINEYSGKNMFDTGNDLLHFVSQEIMGICKVMLQMYSKEQLGDLHQLILDTLADINNNSLNNATIHQTDGKVH